MEIKHLTSFVAVSELGSMTAAARRVNSNYHIMRDAPQKAAVRALLEIIEKNRLFQK